MISKIRVKNFRSLRDVELTLKRGSPTVLIGPSGTGKSTLLEALDFLSKLVQHGLLHAVRAHEERGGHLRTLGVEDDVFLEVVFDKVWLRIENFVKFRSVSYQIALRPRAESWEVVFESVDLLGTQSKSKPSTDVLSRREGRVYLKNSASLKVDTVEMQEQEVALHAIRHKEFYPALQFVRELLVQIGLYPGLWASPPWMWGVGERLEEALMWGHKGNRLDKWGRSLTQVLHHLSLHEVGAWKVLWDCMEASFPQLASLDFVKKEGSYALVWEDRRYAGHGLTLRDMSRGMVSMLYVLGATFSYSDASLMAFDEPDAHLHPIATQKMLQMLTALAKRTTVLMTTHAEWLLDEFVGSKPQILVCRSGVDGAVFASLEEKDLRSWRKSYFFPSMLEEVERPSLTLKAYGHSSGYQDDTVDEDASSEAPVNDIMTVRLVKAVAMSDLEETPEVNASLRETESFGAGGLISGHMENLIEQTMLDAMQDVDDEDFLEPKPSPRDDRQNRVMTAKIDKAVIEASLETQIDPGESREEIKTVEIQREVILKTQPDPDKVPTLPIRQGSIKKTTVKVERMEKHVVENPEYDGEDSSEKSRE